MKCDNIAIKLSVAGITSDTHVSKIIHNSSSAAILIPMKADLEAAVK